MVRTLTAVVVLLILMKPQAMVDAAVPGIYWCMLGVSCTGL